MSHALHFPNKGKVWFMNENLKSEYDKGAKHKEHNLYFSTSKVKVIDFYSL